MIAIDVWGRRATLSASMFGQRTGEHWRAFPSDRSTLALQDLGAGTQSVTLRRSLWPDVIPGGGTVRRKQTRNLRKSAVWSRRDLVRVRPLVADPVRKAARALSSALWHLAKARAVPMLAL